MAKTITCVDCGLEVEARRANTKRCDVCRVLNSIQWLLSVKQTEVECHLCGEAFMPLRRGDVLCGEHSVTSIKIEGRCGFCKQNRPDLLSEQVKVCRKCATEPANRKLLAQTLYAKQQKLKEANGKKETSD